MTDESLSSFGTWLFRWLRRPRIQLRALLLGFALLSVFLAIYIQRKPSAGWPNLRGTIVDSDGMPIANVDVTIGWPTFAKQHAKTDLQGRFFFSTVQSGTILMKSSPDQEYESLVLMIHVSHDEYYSKDGQNNWEIQIPKIHNHCAEWNLELMKKSNK